MVVLRQGTTNVTSTALIPIDLYDSVEMEPLKPAIVEAKAVKSIRATLQGICLEGAISVLDAFGYTNDEFYGNKDKWSIRDLVNEDYFPECQGRRADETLVFWFWGGPPTRLKWYQGTLQTFLEDRILGEIESRGVAEVSRWVGVDLK